VLYEVLRHVNVTVATRHHKWRRAVCFSGYQHQHFILGSSIKIYLYQSQQKISTEKLMLMNTSQ
jgi:hypothetical protein